MRQPAAVPSQIECAACGREVHTGREPAVLWKGLAGAPDAGFRDRTGSARHTSRSRCAASIHSRSRLRAAALGIAVTAEPSAATQAIAPEAAGHRRNRPAVAQRRTRLIIELSCVLCGRDLGVLESDAWPAYGAVVLRRKGFEPVMVADWRRLRCAVCGGAAFPDEITSRLVRTEKPLDWDENKPRRGRPPKSVVEARKAVEAQ